MEIKSYSIHGDTFYTVQDVYEAIGKTEGVADRRTWLDTLIRQGKIPYYTFSKIRLLDQTGLDMVLAFRRAVVEHGLRLSAGDQFEGYTVEVGKHTKRRIKDLFTEVQLSNEEGVSRSRLERVRNERPECTVDFGSVTGYLPCAIEAARAMEDQPKGRKPIETPKTLRKPPPIHLEPLTRLQKYVLRLRDNEGLSFDQIAERATAEGMSRAKSGRSTFEDVYLKAITKLEQYQTRYGINREHALSLENQRELRKAQGLTGKKGRDE